MEEAGKASHATAEKVKELSDPLTKLKKAWDVVVDPIVLVYNAQDKLRASADKVKSTFSAVVHPIDTFRGKLEASKLALQAQREEMMSQQAAMEKAKALYDKTAAEVDRLTNALAESIEKTGPTSDETRKLANELSAAKSSANFAKGELDKYSTAEEQAGEEAEKAEPKVSSFGSVLGKGVAAGAAAAGAALLAAGKAVVSLATQSISGYGEYEQLVGGVEKLYGEAADSLMQYAENGYASAGMSANDYMTNVTGFSASLISSLAGDTQKAADTANMIMQDIADNANTFGKYSAEELAGVYQALAKGQYQTLDNLMLGYGGTQEGLQQLIDKAVELQAANGVVADYSIDNFADIAEAIHIVQEDLGIAGTTANEAATTIQGSASSMKAAWENLVVGMADPDQDMDMLLGNFVDSVVTFADNLLPRITALAPRLVDGIVQLAIVAADMLPGFVEEILPSLVTAITTLVDGVTTSVVPLLPELIAALLPALISAAESLFSSLATAIPPILTAALEAIPQLVKAAVTIVASLASALLDPTNLSALLNAGMSLLEELSNGITEFLPQLIDKLPEIIEGILGFITENLPQFLESGVGILLELAFGIIEAIPQLVEQLPEIISAIVEFVVENLPLIAEQGARILGELVVGLLGAIPELTTGLLEVAGEVLKSFDDLVETAFETGVNLLTGLWDGISNKVEWLGQQIGGTVGKIKSWFTGEKGFDTHSPSKWAKAVGEFVSIGLANGIAEKASEAETEAEKMAKNIYDSLSTWAEKQVKYNELTLQDQLDMWRAIQDQFIVDSEQYEQAEEKIFDLRKQIQEEYYDKVEEITQNITDLEENYQNTLADRTQQIFDIYGVFDEIPERQRVAGSELMRNLTNQISLMEEFYTGLEKLTARGVGDDLVDEIRDMGPSAISELTALLNMSDEKLSEYATLYEEKQRLANDIATKELEELRTDTAAQIAQNLEELQQLYDSEAPAVGQAFADGLAEGIKNGMSTVISSAVEMAQAAVDAVRDTLGIHSPSLVFAGIGQNMALGLAGGWEREFASTKDRIIGGLDFGEIQFKDSTAARSSSAIVNSALANQSVGGEYSINVQIDGETAARVLFDPLRGVIRQRGVALA